jgi:hypothetical protein
MSSEFFSKTERVSSADRRAAIAVLAVTPKAPERNGGVAWPANALAFA